MGNCELHLIKGVPLVHDGTNLIVCHISVEVDDVANVFRKLKAMNIPFEQNVSVPRGTGKAASEGGSIENTLTQYFLRDPDGYYIEICNCGILTDFCLGKSQTEFEGYAEGATTTMSSVIASIKLYRLARRAKQFLANRPSLEEIISKAVPATEVDEIILKNFIKRRVVYGDICQSYSEDELREILLLSGNSAPISIAIMQTRLKEEKKKALFTPPAFIRHDSSNDAGRLFRPDSFFN